MAQCVQPRCNERRRFMRRQLHSWAPTMLYVLGVERVAEQLMGRRQWRGCHSRSPRSLHDDDLYNNNNTNNNNNHHNTTELSYLLPGSHPTDWRPADKCSFCLSDAVTTSPSIDEDTARASCSPQSPSSSNTTSAPLASSATSATTTTSTSINPPGQAELTAAVLRLATPEAVDIRETDSPESSRESGRLCGSNGGRVAVDGASGLRGGASSPGNRSSSSPELPSVAVSAMSAVAAATAAALRGVVPPPTSAAAATMAAAAAAAAAAAVSAPYPWCVVEQPLDLSAKGAAEPPGIRVAPLDNRHIFRAKPRVSTMPGTRRSYTEGELQAALRDIQSGKLGTRRAAVIYGIPRSTLRNKVYKLERERERDAPIPAVVSGTNVAEDDESGAEDERLVERELQKPLLSVEDIMRLCERGGGINTGSGTTPGTNEHPCFPGLDKAGLAPYITQLLAGAAEAAVAAVNAGGAPTSAPTTPSSATTPPHANNVILKIPSFKPSNCATSAAAAISGESNSASAEPSNSTLNEVSSHHSAPSSPVPAAFKDAIAKGMAAKLASAVGVTPSLNVTSHSSSSMSLSSMNLNNEKKSCSASGKGTRPKRGKYRNYDRDSLVEAVRAVQRGEMSVHRAGSYYGVPHSTLEYKVKERHLMRPRKREPKTNPSLVGSATTSSHDKPLSVGQTPPNKPGLPVAPAFQNGLKLSTGIFDPAGLAPILATPYFWRGAPTGFGPPAVAAGVSTVPPSVTAPPTMPKTTRQIAESLYDGTSANGSFLDGIIRSSLDNGISSSAAGNRALLDQLCRSGHFGPGVPGSAPVSTTAAVMAAAAAAASASLNVSDGTSSSDDENSSSTVAPTSQPESSDVKPEAASQQ